MAYGNTPEEFMARHTRGPRPEPQNVAGLPPVNAQYMRQLSQGGTKVGYGTRGERKRALRNEVIRQQLIESDIAPDAMISQAIGRPISPETAKIAQQFMDPMFGLSPTEAIGFAEMIQRGEPIDQAMAERFAAKGELAAKGSMGDPIKAANQAINKDVLLRDVPDAELPQNRDNEDYSPRSSSGGRFKDETLIPMLIAKRTEQFRTKSGVEGVQSPTVPYQGRLKFDPRAVELALLNPRAPMNSGDGADGKTVAMAINKALTEGRTSFVSRDPRTLEPTGRPNEFIDPSNPDLVLYKYAVDPGGETTSYRVQSRGRQTPESLEAVNKILEQVMGGAPVVNQRLQDPDMFRLQQRLLEASSDPDNMTTPATTTDKFGSTKVNNPALNLMNTIKSMADAPISEVSQAGLVTDASDMDFYRNLVGGDLKELAEKVTVQQQSSARPQNSAINATNNSPVNAPAPQLDVESQRDVLNQLNDQARQNVERGLAGSQTSRNAAMQFLSQFKARMLGR